VTEAHKCEQFAQGRYLSAEWPGVELATYRVASRALTITTHRRHSSQQQQNVAYNVYLSPDKISHIQNTTPLLNSHFHFHKTIASKGL